MASVITSDRWLNAFKLGTGNLNIEHKNTGYLNIEHRNTGNLNIEQLVISNIVLRNGKRQYTNWSEKKFQLFLLDKHTFTSHGILGLVSFT